jgi:hypothetical protein
MSIEATGVCIPIGNREILLAGVYKTPSHAWIDAYLTDVLGFRRKTVMAGDLNAKNQMWNRVVSNP